MTSESTPNVGQPGNGRPANSSEGNLAGFWRDKSEGDKILEASENFVQFQEMQDMSALRQATGHRLALECREPHDVFRSTVAPPFTYDEVPPVIAELAYAYHRATGFDPSGVIVGSMVAAASLITDQCRLQVRPETEWYESPRIWAVLVAMPSAGKSPSIRAAADHIRDMHRAEIRAWEFENKDVKAEDRPPRPALYTSDTTIAALQEILKDNNRGILLRTEEFSSWVGGIDSAEKGEAAQNRGHWLEAYDGGPHQVNRIGRGSPLIDNWSVSVLTAGTPEGIQRYFKKLPDDGMVHRFIPVLMNPPQKEIGGTAVVQQGVWKKVLSGLRTLPPNTITMEPAARARFDEFRDHLVQLSTDVYSVSPQIASTLGKHPGLTARVALTNHCIQYGGHSVLNTYSMDMAIRFVKKAAKHSVAFFDGIVGTSPALVVARSLARSLVADGSVLATVGRQWMSDHCEAFKKEEDDRVRHESVLILEDANWIEPHSGKGSYGGWPRAWNVHPRLWDKFSQQGEEWRLRRKAVADAIGIGNPDEI
jgi:hypothetical protein